MTKTETPPDQYTTKQDTTINEDARTDSISDAYKSAKSISLRLLSQRNHTAAELTMKLRQRRFPESAIQRVISECEKYQYIDEKTMALNYRKRLAEKGYGARYIKSAMRQKGFAEQHILSAFDDYDSVEDEKAAAERALSRKLKSLSPRGINFNTKKKMYNHLISRGFPHELVMKMLGALTNLYEGNEPKFPD
jgi:regulatory protein